MGRTDGISASGRKMVPGGAKEPSREHQGDPLPLAVASERLRGKLGRPRKDGHVTDIAAQQVGVNRGLEGSALAVTATVPRLFSLGDAARYLGISVWTVRDLIANGTLARVRVPLPGLKELRKVLIDKDDLDRLIDGWKEQQI